MQDEEESEDALEQVQELPTAGGAGVPISPPMIQRLIRTGLIIRVGAIRVWWEVVRVAVWLRDSWRRPRDWCWSCRRSTLNFYTRSRERGRCRMLGHREVPLIKVN